MSSPDISRRGYLFAGGGTGGHLYPAIAVAQRLQAHVVDAHVLFVGSARPTEREIVAAAGYEHMGSALVSVRQSWRQPWAFSRALWAACRAARQMIRERGPRVVIGCGGWASVPGVWAARREGVPIVLLEQNVLPGRATRWLSRWADVVCLAFEESRPWLPRGVRTVVTGNPVRAEVAALAGKERGLMPAGSPGESVPVRRLLVLGGSLGSRSLNEAVCSALRSDPAAWRDWEITHQTGRDDVDRTRSLYAELWLNVRVEAYLPELPQLLAVRPLVVTRAGATTLAELACAGCPTIAVPWRGAADDHQTLNARWYAERGALLLAGESAPSAAADVADLRSGLWRLRDDATLCARLTAAAGAAARPDAAAAVAAVIDELASGSGLFAR